jgi:exosortase
VIVSACTAAAIALWAFWPTLTGLAQRWSADPQYSHGFLVPLFAAYILWVRRHQLSELPAEPTWWAAPLLGIAVLLHAGGAYLYSPWLEQISLLPAVVGLCLGLRGWRALWAAAPALVFLLFMIPLPGRLDKALAGPLQQVATLASTNALQTFGFFAQSEGNVIVLSDYELGIVEACSGLRMLVVFLATATAVAITMRRSLLQRVLVVLSALPIAVLCNVIRITTTGIMHETVGHETANLVYHHAAGWLMAPLALAFLGLELLIFRRLFITVDDAGVPLVLARA